jgi:hypothetical protein
MLEHAKKFANRFIFELYLVNAHNEIIEGLQKWLLPFTTDDIRKMIETETYPPLQPAEFAAATPYAEFLEHIDEQRLLEAIAEARPDIMKVIEEMGYQGVLYILKLRAYMLECVKDPSKAQASPAPALQEEELVKAVCEECGRSWPVKKEEFAKITVCPFCGKGP